jgi:hypothetical protein
MKSEDFIKYLDRLGLKDFFKYIFCRGKKNSKDNQIPQQQPLRQDKAGSRKNASKQSGPTVQQSGPTVQQLVPIVPQDKAGSEIGSKRFLEILGDATPWIMILLFIVGSYVILNEIVFIYTIPDFTENLDEDELKSLKQNLMLSIYVIILMMIFLLIIYNLFYFGRK